MQQAAPLHWLSYSKLRAHQIMYTTASLLHEHRTPAAAAAAGASCWSVMTSLSCPLSQLTAVSDWLTAHGDTPTGSCDWLSRCGRPEDWRLAQMTLSMVTPSRLALQCHSLPVTRYAAGRVADFAQCVARFLTNNGQIASTELPPGSHWLNYSEVPDP